MRKIISLLAVFTLFFSLIHQPSVHAASKFKILIDGEVLETDQAPVALGGHILVPLRGIFEALNARVQWNQKAKTVTAIKRDTTVVLTIGSRTATINNQIVTLEAPARGINGRTMVPVRFVSEALGDDVYWNSKTQTVVVTTTAAEEVGHATAVNVTSVSQYGDGRDLRIGFTNPSDTSNVNGYRILVVKAENASSFNLAKAQSVREANYTSAPKYYENQQYTLSAQARDVDGALIRTNQAYKIFILTVGNDRFALSNPSGTITLNGSTAVDAATQVQVNDVSDFGDGRDLRVSFNKAANEDRISLYRIYVVRETDANSFTVSEASRVSSVGYYDVSRTGGNYSQTLSSSMRDVKGNFLVNGVSYRVFVMSVTTNSTLYPNVLSAASNSITLLGSGVGPVTNLAVSDAGDYNNGQDLRVAFTKAANEFSISHYRIFVVRDANASTFSLLSANALANSGNYTDVAKSGGDINQVLTAASRDVNGSVIQNGVSYRVFVMSVGGGSSTGTNALSFASSAITLTNGGMISAVTNVNVADVSDTNSGQDIRVSFNRAGNESNISQYRIFVVMDALAGSFNLNTANALSSNSSLYTPVSVTGGDINLTLPASTRDINGVVIQNGVNYRVFVLSVGGGISWGINTLSNASPVITLSNGNIPAANNLSVADASDYNNGQDLLVSFARAVDETNVNHYRIYVVKDANAASFNLATANAITDNNNYTAVAKTGGNISLTLSPAARDVNGALIQNGIGYKVFVMSVGNAGVSSALSAPSNSILLAPASVAAQVPEVQNVMAVQQGNSNNVTVSFIDPVDESGIAYYAVLLVKETSGPLMENTAISHYTSGKFTAVNKSQNMTVLTSRSYDVDGAPLAYGVPYRIYVLSVANGVTVAASKLSSSSAVIMLLEAPM